MKRKIFFRADAGQSIGYGHFIRTLALADMLKDDFECLFYTQTPTEYQIGELNKVCAYVPLPADDSRFQLFLDALRGDEIVVLDNYYYTTDYQRRIKEKGCKLVCIDDMHDKHYLADAVVNHGPVRPEDFDCEPYTQLCLGNQWSLLRKPFLEPLRSNKRENRLIVCFGGADPQHLTDKVVTMLIELNTPYEITVILGEAAYLSDENRKRVVVKNKLTAQQMAELFETSLVGILPSSSVRIEAVSRGLKVICGYFVDNQQIGFERSLKQGDVLPVYNFNELTAAKLQQALDQIKDFKYDIPDCSKIPFNYKKLMNAL